MGLPKKLNLTLSGLCILICSTRKVDAPTVSASSALKNLKAMLFNENLRTHSPGPNGLPGGYPVLLNKDGADVVLPDDISLEEAI